MNKTFRDNLVALLIATFPDPITEDQTSQDAKYYVYNSDDDYVKLEYALDGSFTTGVGTLDFNHLAFAESLAKMFGCKVDFTIRTGYFRLLHVEIIFS